MPTITSLHLPSLLLLLLPHTLASPFPLLPRNVTIPSTSNCSVMLDRSLSGGSVDVSTWPVNAVISIVGKTTPEHGSPGQGLLDNLKGDCGGLLTDSRWPIHVNSYGTDPKTGQLLGYQAFVLLPAGAQLGCLHSAIEKAEGQDVWCKDVTPVF